MKVKLFKHIGKYLDGNTILKIDEDLTIDLEQEEVVGSRSYATVSNGKNAYRVLVKNNSITIPKAYIKVGVIQIYIETIYNAQKICEYRVEDLIIKESPTEIYSVPELELIKSEVKAYREENEQLKQEIKTLKDLVNGLYGVGVKENA